jgi:hypothetical protein
MLLPGAAITVAVAAAPLAMVLSARLGMPTAIGALRRTRTIAIGEAAATITIAAIAPYLDVAAACTIARSDRSRPFRTCAFDSGPRGAGR